MRFATTLSLFAIGVAVANGDEPRLTIERESVWRSRYVWRGLVLEPKSIYEASTTVSYGSMFLNVWNYARHPGTLIHDGAREADFTLGTSFEAGGWTLTPSFTYFSFPNGWEPRNTSELALEAEHGLGSGWTVFVNHYLDVAETPGGLFAEAGLSYERDLGQGLSLDARASVGRGNRPFNASNFDVHRDAWNVAAGEIGLSAPLGSGWTLRASAAHNRTLDRRLRQAADRPDNAFWSLGLTYAR